MSRPPAPLTIRVESLPPHAYFSEHSHDWAQVVYAISGYLPWRQRAGHLLFRQSRQSGCHRALHRVGTQLGAEFRSLWIAANAVDGLADDATVFAISPLMKALIVEAAEIATGEGDDGYRERVTAMILDQLRRVEPLPGSLPWPRSQALSRLCQALYTDPTGNRTEDAWGRELAMSGRTLRRRFQDEVGMSLRSWLRRMRLFKAIELLGGGMDVTRTAMALGYGSSSAFIYAFRTNMGISPNAYRSALKI